MVRVKICGLMNSDDVKLCVQYGVSLVGFVVDYPTPVPWNLTKIQAKELIAATSPFVSTCVVTGGSVEKVLKLVEETCPNVVQLHYNETLDDINEIAGQLRLRGIKTMKALRINQEGKCDFEISNPVIAARELVKTGISAIVVDSFTKAKPGGTGVTVNLDTFHKIKENSHLPVMLAGGLNPSNIISILHEANPYAIDILTGLEERPGHKDANKLMEFMKLIKEI